MSARLFFGALATYFLASAAAAAVTFLILLSMEGPYDADAARFVASEVILSSLVATFILGLPIAVVGAELLRWRQKLNLRNALLLANVLAALLTLYAFASRDTYAGTIVPQVWMVANCLALGGWFWFYRRIVRPNPATPGNES